MSKILIIDDESAIANLVSDALEDEGFETVICSDGNEAYDYVEAHSSEISLITLDIMMPGLSGLELCRMIRNKVDCPIIFVSAKGKTLDTVLGLEIGGDDYISKPFVVEELVARVKAHLRREQRSKDVYEDGVIKVGDIEIHTGSFEVFKNSKPMQF